MDISRDDVRMHHVMLVLYINDESLTVTDPNLWRNKLLHIVPTERLILLTKAKNVSICEACVCEGSFNDDIM